MTEMTQKAAEFSWLLQSFARDTDGVVAVNAVSSDGLLIAASDDTDSASADRFAAIIAGLTSLTAGAAQCFGMNSVNQIIVELDGGFLFVMTISDGSSLGVLTKLGCDVGYIGYEMTMLVERVGRVLSPEIIAELQNPIRV